ncbi:hypothetical protein LBMAG42_40060 [Deltaproteobacteria bacterium]|nr:hypothetical protein LBMAG42_40060 [Deltaproteobacteria bacterium]
MVRFVLALWACSRGVSAPASAPATAPVAPPPAAAPALPAAVGGLLTDACEPSALVRIGDTWIIGDNETEDRVFAYDGAMRPVASRSLARAVEDVEALVVDGTNLIVVGSHSRNRGGKEKPNRKVVIDEAGGSFAVDLAGCPVCVAAEPLGPNEGGVNIEGAALVGDALALGLRSPLDGGQALVLLVARGAEAGRIEQVLRIPLDGAGIRDMIPFRDGYLVIAGPAADASTPHTLWFLSRLDSPPQRLPVTLPTSTEGIWPLDARHLRYVVDGDGMPGACVTPGSWADIEIPDVQPSRK